MGKSKHQIIAEIYNICEKYFDERTNSSSVLYNIREVVLDKIMEGQFFDNYKARGKEIPIPKGYKKEFGNYFNYLKRFNKPTLMRFVCRELKARQKAESELIKKISELDRKEDLITRTNKLRQKEAEEYYQKLKSSRGR